MSKVHARLATRGVNIIWVGMGQNKPTRNRTAGFSLWLHLSGQAIWGCRIPDNHSHFSAAQDLWGAPKICEHGSCLRHHRSNRRLKDFPAMGNARHPSGKCTSGCGSKPIMGSHFGVGAPPILEPILAGIGMFTGGTIWILTHGQVSQGPPKLSYFKSIWRLASFSASCMALADLVSQGQTSPARHCLDSHVGHSYVPSG